MFLSFMIGFELIAFIIFACFSLCNLSIFFFIRLFTLKLPKERARFFRIGKIFLPKGIDALKLLLLILVLY